jgi:hypothetical protein
LTVVVSNFLVDCNFERTLISENILKLGLVNRHPLLIGIVKLCALKTISILGVEVFFFTQLSQFGLDCLECHLIENISRGRVSKRAIGVADLVKESLLLCRCKTTQEGHQLLKGLLIFLKFLMLSLGEKVEDLNKTFEFF